jgi:hypothetical protein
MIIYKCYYLMKLNKMKNFVFNNNNNNNYGIYIVNYIVIKDMITIIMVQ